MKYTTFLYWIVGSINGILMVLLNILEIFFLLKKDIKQMKSFVYFLNLATSDVFLGVLIILVRIMKLFEPTSANSTIRTIRLFLQMKAVSITLYCSVLTFAVLTIDRMLAVKKPVYYCRILYRTNCIVSVLIWIFATSIVLFLHFLIKDEELEHVLTPWIIIFTSLLAVASYLVTRKALKIRTSIVKKSHQSVEKKFTLFCIKSIVLFMVCWTPLAVFGFLFSSGVNWKYMKEFRFTAYVIAFGNSIGTPILFLSQNGRWRFLFNNKRKTLKYIETTGENTTNL